MMIPKLILATHNKGKLVEFQAMLAGHVGDMVCAKDYNLPEPAETGTTFVENAKIKALAAMRATGLPSLSDDSGLSVNALNGEPGVYSADWAGHPRDFDMAMALVQEKLGDAADRSAFFTSVLVLAFPDETIHVFEGLVHGTLIRPPRGAGGFGYDPMFLPDGYTQTFGEMAPEVKDSISHRARAVEKLIDFFKVQAG
jgi:XTP/dITP diphosphohydrolase